MLLLLKHCLCLLTYERTAFAKEKGAPAGPAASRRSSGLENLCLRAARTSSTLSCFMPVIACSRIKFRSAQTTVSPGVTRPIFRGILPVKKTQTFLFIVSVQHRTYCSALFIAAGQACRVPYHFITCSPHDTLIFCLPRRSKRCVPYTCHVHRAFIMLVPWG